MSFTSVKAKSRSLYLVNPSNANQTFAVHPDQEIARQPAGALSPVVQNLWTPAPNWLTALVDGSGNPTHPVLLAAVQEGSVAIQ